MRCLRTAVALAASLAVLPLPAVAQEDQVAIRSVETERFPELEITVSLSEPEAISHEDVVITEDGVAVTDFKLESLEDSGQAVSVALVIDTSGSMRGAPLAAAQAAATEFVYGLPDHVRVGVLTFSDSPEVLAGVTSDHAAAVSAIAGLEPSGETALYDAVARASSMFSEEGQRNIILLSDGEDTVSSAGLKAAVSAAKESQAVVYAVGLKSGDADVRALRIISGRTDGRYVRAGTSDLSAVYEGLAEELNEQLVISYESNSAGGEELRLGVSTPQGSDEVLFLPTKIPDARTESGIEPVPQAQPLLTGAAGLLVVLSSTFLGCFLVLNMMFGTNARKRRDRKLAELFEVKSAERDGMADVPAGMTWIPSGLVSTAEQISRGRAFEAKLDKRIERAGLAIRAAEFVVVSFCAAIAGLTIGLATRSVVLMTLLFVVGAAAPYVVLKVAAYRRLGKLQEQLPDILGVLAGSLRAGHSFLQALDAVAKEIGGAGSQEFNRVVTEIRLGRPIEDAMNDLAERVDSTDFRWAVLAVNIQRKVGGNLAEVLDTVSDTIRNRQVLRRQVQALSAEGRLSAIILIALPFPMAGYLAMVNPEYIALLYTTSVGLVMVGVATALLGLGVVWMRKVVKADV